MFTRACPGSDQGKLNQGGNFRARGLTGSRVYLHPGECHTIKRYRRVTMLAGLAVGLIIYVVLKLVTA